MKKIYEPAKVTRRKISWRELYRQRPDLRPANQNEAKEKKEAA